MVQPLHFHFYSAGPDKPSKLSICCITIASKSKYNTHKINKISRIHCNKYDGR